MTPATPVGCSAGSTTRRATSTATSCSRPTRTIGSTSRSIRPPCRSTPRTRSRPTDQYGNAAPAFIPHDTNATETEDEAFVALSFVHKLDDSSSIQVAPLYKLSRGVLLSDATHALGAEADPGATASDVTRLAHHAGAIVDLLESLREHIC